MARALDHGDFRARDVLRELERFRMVAIGRAADDEARRGDADTELGGMHVRERFVHGDDRAERALIGELAQHAGVLARELGLLSLDTEVVEDLLVAYLDAF